MTQSNETGRAWGRGWAIVVTSLVVLAVAGWARHVSAASTTMGVGAVSLLATDPHTPATLYAGAECGGLLKSTDGGDTWIVANRGLDDRLIRRLPAHGGVRALEHTATGRCGVEGAGRGRIDGQRIVPA